MQGCQNPGATGGRGDDRPPPGYGRYISPFQSRVEMILSNKLLLVFWIFRTSYVLNVLLRQPDKQYEAHRLMTKTHHILNLEISSQIDNRVTDFEHFEVHSFTGNGNAQSCF